MNAKKMFSGAILVAVVAAIAAGCSAKTNEPASSATSSSPAQQQEAAPGGTRYIADPAASTASYSVDETFLGKQTDWTAVGTTTAFTGEMVVENGAIQPSIVKVDLSTLKSDDSKRDNKVRQVLDTATHKHAIFTISGAEGKLVEGREVPLKLQGEMTIKGTAKPLVFEGKARLEGNTLRFTGTTTFKMTTFGVNPPNIAGFVKVVDQVKLDITYVGKK